MTSVSTPAPFDYLPEDLSPEDAALAEQLGDPDENEQWLAAQDGEWDQFQLTDDTKITRKLRKSPSVLPHEFTQFAFRMPDSSGIGYENFSFNGRRHMLDVYDTPARKIFLFCARQCEKSTLLGNKIITHACLYTAYKFLYVSPSSLQTKTFSNDRIKEPIETSPLLKQFAARSLAMNIFEKQFLNFSKITLRYAFLNADRCRGIPAYGLGLDEFQDLLSDNIPVIEACTTHAPEPLKLNVYAGTPKSHDNNIEFYRSGVDSAGRPMSTQGEWVVPCDKHGGDGGRHWNILGEKNIGRKSLICDKCGSQIHPTHPDAQWAHQQVNGVFESYRINQLMVPWRSWGEILLDFNRYPREQFYNEVLGLSYDGGSRPLTMAQLQGCCRPDVTMAPAVLEALRKMLGGRQVFAGIDWGYGEGSFTILSLGAYVEQHFRIFFIHRFTGEDFDPEIQMAKIMSILTAYQVFIVGCDYGAGHEQNAKLVRKYGVDRVQKFQYVTRPKKKVLWDHSKGYWKMSRTEIMSDIFGAIKRKQIELPRWEEFYEPFGKDILNINSEYNETLRMLQYVHRRDTPDDSFHSILYCFMASMIARPRPDIIAPRKEVNGNSPIQQATPGNVYQG